MHKRVRWVNTQAFIGGLKPNVILAGSGLGFCRFHFLMNLSRSKTMMEFGVIHQN